MEITAALIGLATGLALGYQAFSASQSATGAAASQAATSMDLILASAPFFMVALAELTKIPVATLLFSVSWLWKPFILIFLLLLAGITFETVFMGLERAATLRQLQYETLRQDIDSLRQEQANLTSSIEEAGKVDSVADAQKTLNDLMAQAAAERTSLEEQVAGVDKEIEGRVTLSPEAARVRDQLAETKSERAELVEHQRADLDGAVLQFEKQRDSYVKRIEIYVQNGDPDSAKKEQSKLDALVNPRKSIEARQATELAPFDVRIGQLQAQFDGLLSSLQPMTDKQRSELIERRGRFVTRLDASIALWNERLDAAQDQLAAAQRVEATKDAATNSNQERIEHILKDISSKETDRIRTAREDQIRRIAGRFFGVKAEDVTESQAEVVALVWFGSLAGLAALAGPLTAITALALQRIAAGQLQQRPADSPLAHLLRLLLTRWRWKRVRTVIVPERVEVEVVKEVEKQVPVEVEKLIKEILYVPVLTDDPDFVLQAMKSTLPPEVTEQVQTAARRGRRASKAQHVPS